ncbi:DUF3472 domain-containing protein [Sphingobacterium psychroaquaticum]|uniref:DUF3472 domain-containing protein n=1 Tax=Sphingobacterium psychroaquaticum TaxID=561061 RepID=UPI001F102477|nr:DUF3472 domain-containing protein [Sphingobacterium psychroaquaticum]
MLIKSMKPQMQSLMLLVLFMAFLNPVRAQKNVNQATIHIPVSGNTWQSPQETNTLHRTDGIIGGKSSSTFTTYIRFGKAGKFVVGAELGAVEKAGKLVFDIEGEKRTIAVSTSNSTVEVGTFTVKDSGYVAIRVKSLSGEIPAIRAYQIRGESDLMKTSSYVASNDDNYFYWGRRGPSVHLGYQVPTSKDVEYYYNEVTVPVGSDVIGSYFMANGFSQGYFGMQVNSAQERRILFSVWSPFHTDDPKAIPDEQKIVMTKKGKDVYTGEFGNEGSGGQSFLKYNWKAGNTYKFMLRGRPVENNMTEFTAWFFAAEEGHWRLIAQFLRPATHTYLKGFHSFLENFSPSQGYITREVSFNNQWARDIDGEWHDCKQARFTADATARKGYRLDYQGGLKAGVFYLKNCGFFGERTAIGSMFVRESSKNKPTVAVSDLPVQ